MSGGRDYARISPRRPEPLPVPPHKQRELDAFHLRQYAQELTKLQGRMEFPTVRVSPETRKLLRYAAGLLSIAAHDLTDRADELDGEGGRCCMTRWP